MQYHYVIGYNTDTKKWFVESDTTAYFSDGNIWDEDKFHRDFWGWKVPEEGSDDEALDYALLRTLYSLVDVIPIPKESQHVLPVD